MPEWIALVLTLPSESGAARMRVWRALKAAGAAVLRDGVYLLPERERCRAALVEVAADVEGAGGVAHLLRVQEPDEARFAGLFARDAEYGELLDEIAACRRDLSAAQVVAATRQVRRLRKSFTQLAEVDFFPGEAQRQVAAALLDLESSLSRVLSPDEPHAAEGAITPRPIADYQGRRWATRARPWVDRLACAWLIRRFIDPDAEILWLANAGDCPADALGFDFDGASFSHVGNRVSFETLMASFDLHQPGLPRLAALVHYLDVGGVQPPEAVGVEQVLQGLRQGIADDDQLLACSLPVFDGLLAAFEKHEEGQTP